MKGILKDRYEIRAVLGQGGMGVVYRAYDTVIRREVALKTIRDAPEKLSLEMFQTECDVLASFSHPNIVEIFDVGEFEEDGVVKPYFVMPLLRGTTLEELIKSSSQRLSVEGVAGILGQVCRGLQAAHERGLVHRDLKPSNIFVLEDDSARIIDFGVARILENRTVSGPKGTLIYMAPEQVQLKPATALSDIFSLGVVAYEAFTRRRPFEGASARDIADAILNHIPQPVSDLNPAVGTTIGRVVHKAMAKQPAFRFASAREFGDALQKALRNEPIPSFDSSRIQPRIERAARAFEQGDAQFASDILNELQAEGHLDPAIATLRRRIDTTAKQKRLAQLVESARARMEEDEYPLALQKVQEILELDPDHAEGLTLQQTIERRRSEVQIEDWLRLARQHLASHAYSHARQALENVLGLRSDDTRAIGLLADAQRREQEYVRFREEKEQLYRAAMEAYEKAELSTALSRLEKVLELDRRAPEISSPERGASYQNLYNQVRSEHDAIMGGYAEARRLLADGEFARALQVCDEFLTRYPNQALFQALKFDIEGQQRQRLSAFVAEVDRRAEEETDLDRRVEILREAVEKYPDEPHLGRSLRLARDKRDLVNGIVAKARRLEERGQFAEALGQWEILRTMYAQYPGLEFEIERVSRRREQQSRTDARARWVEQVDRQLESGDFSRAADLVRAALAEFPDDAELLELEKAAARGVERSAEAAALGEKGRALCGKGAWEEGLDALRRARAINEGDPVLRGVLVSQLLARARGLLEKDWAAAGELLREAGDLDPANAQARSMMALVSDRKRDTFVDLAVSRARQLQSENDVPAALSQVEEALRTYPSAARLLQLQSTLQKSLAETNRAATRRNDLEKIRALEHQAESAATATELQPILEQVRATAGQHAEEEEFRTIAAGVETRWATLTGSAPRASFAAQAPESLTLTYSSVPEPPPAAASAPPAPVQEPAPAPLAAVPPPPTPTPRPARPAGRIPRGAWIGAASAAAVLIALVAGVKMMRTRPGSAPAAAFHVDIRTVPSGAVLAVDDRPVGLSDLRLDFAPGTHKLTARLDGYRPAASTFNTGPGQPGSVQLTLEPVPAQLRLFTDLENPQITLDGQPAGGAQGGQLLLDSVAPGAHTLKVSAGGTEAVVAFEVRPAAVPVVTGPISARDTVVVAVGGLGQAAHVYGSMAAGAVAVDGQPKGDMGPPGVALDGLTAGSHEISIGAGDDRRKVVAETSPAPTLAVHLTSARNVGTLVVVSGEDGARVLLDGKAQRATTRRGELRIPNLPVKNYAVQVSKPGFLPEAEQHVSIRKGEDARVVFQLRPVPTVAVLRIEGAAPNTQVLVDGKPAGVAAQDGTVSIPEVAPGEHAVELRRDQYKAAQLRRTFAAGQTVVIGGNDVVLQPAVGQLRLNVSPAGAEISIARNGDTPRVVTGTTLNLPEGSYTVSGRAPKYAPQSVTVEVVAGQTRQAVLQLAAEKAAPASAGMEGWQKPGEWSRDGGWYVRRGGNFTLFRPAGAGTYTFSFQMRRGKHLRYVAHFVDDRNYALLEMDENFFYRKSVVNGKTRDLLKKPHGLVKSGDLSATVDVTVTPKGIVQRIQTAKGWTSLDEWNEAGLDSGCFGFLVRGRDELALSNFSFKPAR